MTENTANHLTIIGRYNDIEEHNQTMVTVATPAVVEYERHSEIREKLHKALEAENIGLDLAVISASGEPPKTILNAFFEPILSPAQLGTAYSVMVGILDVAAYGRNRLDSGVTEIRIQEKPVS